MAPRPTAERPPSGLNSYWTHVWDYALEVLKDQGTWAWEQKPMLDEYVFALVAAERARQGFEWLDHLSEVESADDIDWKALASIASGVPTQWDRHVKRAAALARQLILTPEAQRAHGIFDEEDEGEAEGDDFGLDAPPSSRRLRVA